jgi:hypothetical protein
MRRDRAPVTSRPRRALLRALGCIGWLSVLGAVTACDQKPQAEISPPQGSAPSPNASILPAPLPPAGELVQNAARTPGGPMPSVGIPVDSAGRLIIREPEPPPPVPIHVSEPLPRDTIALKDATVGLTLTARWKWLDLPARPKVPELSPAGLDAAMEQVQANVSIDLVFAGRMRMLIDNPVMPLPYGSEIRSRADHYGHALVWPNGRIYRLLAAGSLRALFAERRPDVTPLVRAKPKPAGRGKLHGLSTTLSTIETKMGKLTIEQASIPGSGRSGPLLCRFLVELVASDPASEACSSEAVPLGARYEWAVGGRSELEVTGLTNRQDIPPGYAFVPPPAAIFKPGELPPHSSGIFLDLGKLAAFHKRAVKGTDPLPPGAPGEGVMAVNHTETLRYLILDGVPVAWVAPGARRFIIGPRAGQYGVAWRDFFGTELEPQRVVQLPGIVEVGEGADGGTSSK